MPWCDSNSCQAKAPEWHHPVQLRRMVEVPRPPTFSLRAHPSMHCFGHCRLLSDNPNIFFVYWYSKWSLHCIYLNIVQFSEMLIISMPFHALFSCRNVPCHIIQDSTSHPLVTLDWIYFQAGRICSSAGHHNSPCCKNHDKIIYGKTAVAESMVAWKEWGHCY